VAIEEQLEDEPDLLGLDRIDGELLLDACAAPFRLHRRVAEGRARAVPEALPRILLHGAQDETDFENRTPSGIRQGSEAVRT
jgi:hypothetical protein